MADLTDDELPGYCEIHCRTERALFHSTHLNRMLELAGHPPEYFKSVPEGWHTVRENTMDPLVKLANERMATAPSDAPADPDPIEELVDTLDLGAQPEQGDSAAPKDQP